MSTESGLDILILLVTSQEAERIFMAELDLEHAERERVFCNNLSFKYS